MAKLPPGLKEGDFQAALGEIRKVVGKDWLFTSEEDVALYRDFYSPMWGEDDERLASAALAPDSVEQVQAVVKIANQYSLPIYPISTGRNLTYGGSAPVYSGSIVMDLRRMNRILDVSTEDRSCLVEPGVSYFDLYRHLRQNKTRLWVDTADPGWGGLIGNALDHGVGYTGGDFRDHFDAHCGMEVVLGNGDLVRTGMGANPKAKSWQVYKYGIGPWVDGIFSQSNFGIVTKMGFWLMEEPEMGMRVTVTAARHEDIHKFLEIFKSLAYSQIIKSQMMLASPIMSQRGGTPDAELTRLRVAGAAASSQDWARYAESKKQPFWSATFCFYGPANIIAASWEHTKDRFSEIPGIKFEENETVRFPLTDEQAENVPAKARFGIPSLIAFGSRNASGVAASEGHLDFSPMLSPRGDEILALAAAAAKVYADFGLPMPAVGGAFYHRRGMIMFYTVPTYKNAEANRKSRALYERLLAVCAEGGWNLYRVHARYQAAAVGTYNFNNGALHRLHETLKDSIDPKGVLSAGRYGIMPKHLRGKNA